VSHEQPAPAIDIASVRFPERGHAAGISSMTEPSLPRLRASQKAAILAATAVVVWFALRRLNSSVVDAIDVVQTASVVQLVAAGCTALAAMTAIACGWVVLVRGDGAVTGPRTIISWYFLGEITKYLPGGLWAVVGRGELAARNVGRRAAYTSVTHSLLLLFGAAAVPSVVAVLGFEQWSLPIRILCAALLTAVLPAILIFVRRPLSVIVPTVLWYALAWCATGLTTLFVAQSLDVSLGLIDAVTITAAAWLAGFAIVFVPGGVGVREAVFVALAPASVQPSQALAIALCARLLFVAADMVGAGLGLVFRGAAGTDGAHG